MAFLELRSVSCGYATKKVLNNISLSVNEGDFLGVIGPNGAGKSTLFRLITGILKPWDGNVFYNGNDLFMISRRERALSIATMPQLIETASQFSVEEFVLMGRFPHRKRWSALTQHDRSVLEESLAVTGMLELRGRLLNELSGGERQRAALAQAFAQEPQLLLLDEPTAHLDLGHQIEILDLIKKRSRVNKLTVIMVLHDLNMAAEYCDNLMLLHNGTVYKHGTPADVLTYQIIEEVYKTIVVVRENPISGKPHVVPISKHSLGNNTAGDGKQVRILRSPATVKDNRISS